MTLKAIPSDSTEQHNQTRAKQVSILILGAGWTSTFLIPLLEKEEVAYTATSTTGRDGTLKFVFDPAATDKEQYSQLPDAETILITFPLKGTGQSKLLLGLYTDSHPQARPNYVQLGSTGIWQIPDQTLWVTRHSKYDTSNARAIAEDELLSLGGCVLNLSGLWGGTRQPRNFVKRVAPTKEQLKAKTSLHMIHGQDVARAILALHRDYTGGERWVCLSLSSFSSENANSWRKMLTDLLVYDWWALALGWGEGGSEGKDKDAEGPLVGWVTALMEEDGVKALPRSMEQLGRCYDTREFWNKFKIAPVRSRI